MSVRTSVLSAIGAVAATAALVVTAASGGASATVQPRIPALPMSTPYPTDPPEVGPGELVRHLKYSCTADFAGLPFGTHEYTVLASADYPEVARPGDVLPAREAKLSLYPVSPSSRLHQGVRELVGGRFFAAAADDASWAMTTAGRTTDLGNALSVPRRAVPPYVPEGGADLPEPWNLVGTTSLPAITVPSDAQGALWLSAPRRITLSGPLEKEDGSADPGLLQCTAPSDRLVGGIALAGSSNPTPPTAGPDPDPTASPPTGPTTPPTDPPTSDPTTGPSPDPQGPVSVGPGVLRRTVAYTCRIEAAGLDLGTHQLAVDASVDVPETAAAGDVLAARAAQVDITPTELLRQSVSLVLGAQEFTGGTADTTWSLTTAGRSESITAGGLVLPRGPVPAEPPNVRWTASGSVRLPAITVPQDAARGLWLGLPTRLPVRGELIKADGSTFPTSWDCVAPTDRVLGGIALQGWDYPDAPPTEPTTDTPPTTSAPTTSAPTVPPPTPGPGDYPASNPNAGSAGPVAPGTLRTTLPYVCRVMAGGLDLGDREIDLRASAEYPEPTVRPGTPLAARPVDLQLRLPELLRSAVAELLAARSFSGRTDGTAWTLRNADVERPLAADDLRVEPQPVPQDVNAPWLLRGRVQLPAVETDWVTAPDSLGVDLPERFSLRGDFVGSDGSAIPSSLNCLAPRAHGLARIPTVPQDPPTVVPTSIATTPATSSPPSAPTSAPPVLVQPTVRVATLGLWRAAVFTVGVQAKGVVPGGEIVVRLGDRTVARGRLVLGVAVLTAGRLPRGEHTVTVDYSGDRRVAARSVTTSVRIR